MWYWKAKYVYYSIHLPVSSDRTGGIRFSDLLFSYRLISDCLQSEEIVWNHRQSCCSARPGLMACVHVYFSRATLSHVYCRFHFFLFAGNNVRQIAEDICGSTVCIQYDAGYSNVVCGFSIIICVQRKCVRFIFYRGTPLRHDCASVSWKLRATASVEEKTDITVITHTVYRFTPVRYCYTINSSPYYARRLPNNKNKLLTLSRRYSCRQLYTDL